MVWSLAQHQNWNFCAPYDPMLCALAGFPICPPGFPGSFDAMPQFEFISVKAMNESGIYFLNPANHPNLLLNIINEHEHDVSNASLWSNSTVKEWRNMILDAPLNNNTD